jgi:transcription elongation factor GreA
MFNQLTKEDINKMQKEIEHRKLVVRKEAIEAVKEARAHGDLSENFEYYAAKRDKNKNEGRIRYLERMIKTAKIIEDNSSEDEIGLNNTFELYIEEDDVTESFRVVTTIRGDSLKNLVSNISPIGKSVLGKKVGDRVLIRVNDNYSYYAVIKKIYKTNNEEDDEIKTF